MGGLGFVTPGIVTPYRVRGKSFFVRPSLSDSPTTSHALITKFHSSVQIVIEYLSTLTDTDLTVFRPVGRNKLPSTLIGLLVHIAEHTMRHLGQLLVTVRFLKVSLNA